MLTHVRPAVVLLAMFTLLTGIAYPLAMTGIVNVIAPSASKGSLILRDNVVVGSTLIGQPFTSPQYFRGRPSATSGPDPKDDTKTVDAPYNAAGSAGSNLGPLSKKLRQRVEADAAALRQGPDVTGEVPADAVTTSASGLDPHISPAFAMRQVSFVAATRKVAPQLVEAILRRHVERPRLAVLGEPRVNVLMLNLALDAELGRVPR